MLSARKAQAAMEYMIMLGFALAIILPLWLYVNASLSNTNQDLDATYARSAVNKVRDAADSVFVQGPPAQMYLEVEMPHSVLSTSVSGKEVMIVLDAPGGNSEVYAVTLANVSGELPARQGRVRILVKAETNFVNITE
ncbi:MAG: hypothetical protein V1835_00280 [Candidatus Micrarchaeota archaeon]